MTTNTIPKTVSDRLYKTALDEHSAWQRGERQTAVSRLEELESEFAETIPPLDEKIAEANQAIEAAKAALKEAEAVRHKAIWNKTLEYNRIDGQMMRLRNRVENELTDHRITDALDRLQDTDCDTCETPIDEEPPAKYGGDRLLNRERLAKIQKRLAWIRETARPALMKLRYSTTADLGAAIDLIMADLPAL